MATMPVFDISKVDLSDAIKTVKGRELPGRVLVTFEDPRCGFCKRLHQTLNDVPDLVLYTFPVSFLGPQSRAMKASAKTANAPPARHRTRGIGSNAWTDATRRIPG